MTLKRKIILAIASASLGTAVIAGGVGAANVSNPQQPFNYRWDGHTYGSQFNNVNAIPEPGNTNRTANGAPRQYQQWNNPNNLPGK